jgi:hypothetical protein
MPATCPAEGCGLVDNATEFGRPSPSVGTVCGPALARLAPPAFVRVTCTAPPSHAGSAMSPTVTEVTLPREVVNEYENPFASHLGTAALPAPRRVDPAVSDAANAKVVETATAAAAVHAIAFFTLEDLRRRFGERSAFCIETLRSHSC